MGTNAGAVRSVVPQRWTRANETVRPMVHQLERFSTNPRLVWVGHFSLLSTGRLPPTIWVEAMRPGGAQGGGRREREAGTRFETMETAVLTDLARRAGWAATTLAMPSPLPPPLEPSSSGSRSRWCSGSDASAGSRNRRPPSSPRGCRGHDLIRGIEPLPRPGTPLRHQPQQLGSCAVPGAKARGVARAGMAWMLQRSGGTGGDCSAGMVGRPRMCTTAAGPEARCRCGEQLGHRFFSHQVLPLRQPHLSDELEIALECIDVAPSQKKREKKSKNRKK